MSNVIDLPCYTRLNIEPDKVLTAALDKLDEVVVVGQGKDGKFYFASSVADGGDVLWYFEKAKYKLIKITEEMEE